MFHYKNFGYYWQKKSLSNAKNPSVIHITGGLVTKKILSVILASVMLLTEFSLNNGEVVLTKHY
jgi:predicted nuclease of predicted toxin-antitoxin system